MKADRWLGDTDGQLAATGMREDKDSKIDTAKNFLTICLLDLQAVISDKQA